jgi:hypothetical protein
MWRLGTSKEPSLFFCKILILVAPEYRGYLCNIGPDTESVLLQDDLVLVESDLMINHTKVANLEASNKGLHAQLARMREELKTA